MLNLTAAIDNFPTTSVLEKQTNEMTAIDKCSEISENNI